MKHLKLFEDNIDTYEIVFLPSGVILDLTIDILWDKFSYESNDYDIEWDNELKMYKSKDEHLSEIYKKIEYIN